VTGKSNLLATPHIKIKTLPPSSGGINYGHSNFDLNSVTMDDSTNSVYLTTGRNSDNTPRAGWYAYTGHEIDDQGLCTGSGLGRLPDGCINLNGDSRGRIRCVRDL
jgi:hypothetical protein